MANLHSVGLAFVFLWTWTWNVECDQGKRLILHDDADVAAAIQNLTAEVFQLKSTLQSAESEVAQLKSTVTTLQSAESEVAQLKSTVSTLQSTASEVAQLKSTVSTLQSTMSQLQANGTGSGTYVRWGRNTCPSDNERVYKGYAGGNRYSNSGGGANTLCLTDEPQWGHFDDAVSFGGKIYGAEYEVFGPSSQYFGQNIGNEDAVCSVCRSPRPSVVMIPGRQDCYPGWTKEYSGYLVSEAIGHTASSEYNCLDIRPEFVPGGREDKDGTLFYLVDAICGSLTCPPYVDSRELTCVVCSK